MKMRSLPLRERGLKHRYSIPTPDSNRSLPLRERGLKQSPKFRERR